MTDNEINAAIAEACGKLRRVMSKEECKQARREWAKEEPTPYDELTYPQEFEGTIPDYYHDLNAMHEAERLLSNDPTTVKQYALALGYVVSRDANRGGVDTAAWEEEEYQFATATATAPQRAEAFLRTIGKWREV